MASLLPVAFLLPALVALPPALGAQQPTRGLELAAGYLTWGGGDMEGFDGGLRLQGTAFLPVSGVFELGFRALYGWEGVENSDHDVSELSLGVVAHRALGGGGGVRPFAEATVGWSRLHIGDGGDIPIVERDGIAIGPRIGVELPVGAIRTTLAAEATYNSYGDARVVQGTPPGASGDSGWHYGATVGVIFGD